MGDVQYYSTVIHLILEMEEEVPLEIDVALYMTPPDPLADGEVDPMEELEGMEAAMVTADGPGADGADEDCVDGMIDHDMDTCGREQGVDDDDVEMGSKGDTVYEEDEETDGADDEQAAADEEDQSVDDEPLAADGTTDESDQAVAMDGDVEMSEAAPLNEADAADEMIGLEQQLTAAQLSDPALGDHNLMIGVADLVDGADEDGFVIVDGDGVTPEMSQTIAVLVGDEGTPAAAANELLVHTSHCGVHGQCHDAVFGDRCMPLRRLLRSAGWGSLNRVWVNFGVATLIPDLLAYHSLRQSWRTHHDE